MKRPDLDPEAQQFANSEGVQVRRARRIPPRLPAGTNVLSEPCGAKTCMRWNEDARFPSLAERLMAKHLRDLVVQVERATSAVDLVTTETLRAVEAAYSAAFPWPNWFPWFFEYLQRARTAWYDCETEGFIPDDPLEAGRAVIHCTRDALSEAIVFCPLLPWWLTPELVTLLIQRFSFGRGGGPHRALSYDRLRELLLHPPEMAKYLRSLTSGEKRFSRELAELERDVPDDAPAPREVDEPESVPTIQHSIKAEHLGRLADDIEKECGAPALLMLPERLDALHRAYAAVSNS